LASFYASTCHLNWSHRAHQLSPLLRRTLETYALLWDKSLSLRVVLPHCQLRVYTHALFLSLRHRYRAAGTPVTHYTHFSPTLPDRGPVPLTPSRPSPLLQQSYTYLRSITTFPDSHRDYNLPFKLPPNHTSSDHNHFALPASGPGGRTRQYGTISGIRTTNSVVSNARDDPSRSSFGDGDPLDPSTCIQRAGHSPLSSAVA